MRGILQSSKMWDSMILDFFHGWKKTCSNSNFCVSEIRNNSDLNTVGVKVMAIIDLIVIHSAQVHIQQRIYT